METPPLIMIVFVTTIRNASLTEFSYISLNKKQISFRLFVGKSPSFANEGRASFYPPGTIQLA
jgi:hypothetical protein